MVKVGKIRVNCDFFLVFVYGVVNLESSSMSCNKGAGGKTGAVDITTPEGYKFTGVVKPPNKIIQMTGGDLFDFLVLYLLTLEFRRTQTTEIWCIICSIHFLLVCWLHSKKIGQP